MRARRVAPAPPSPVTLSRTPSAPARAAQVLFRRSQLRALVDVHGSTAGFGGTLTEQEVLVIRGALDLTAKTASKSMTPLDKVRARGLGLGL